ncbi:hypothetical protein CNECB9_3880018 [Cupriavidus necator]|uniref:Uncharacterized protein n=1 Tax=Cupriavidus necator TaxID=106590 RepID=A0A1K0IWG5_CUPNE|nr:hypothetical protein CNECB9_3880018 [Cupriavidus necator]
MRDILGCSEPLDSEVYGDSQPDQGWYAGGASIVRKGLFRL